MLGLLGQRDRDMLRLASPAAPFFINLLVVPHGISDPTQVEEIARAAIKRGGGVPLGIGDNPAAFPDLPNAALVKRAAAWAAEAGRPLASPNDVRHRFGMHQ